MANNLLVGIGGLAVVGLILLISGWRYAVYAFGIYVLSVLDRLILATLWTGNSIQPTVEVTTRILIEAIGKSQGMSNLNSWTPTIPPPPDFLMTPNLILYLILFGGGIMGGWVTVIESWWVFKKALRKRLPALLKSRKT